MSVLLRQPHGFEGFGTVEEEEHGPGSHLNDFQVSPDGNTLYIADASFFAQTPALIVYDVATRRARRLLDGHSSVMPDFYTPVVQGPRMEAFGLVAIRPGVDSIVLDRSGEHIPLLEEGIVWEYVDLLSTMSGGVPPAANNPKRDATLARGTGSV